MPTINPRSRRQRVRLYHDFPPSPPQYARVTFDSYDVFYKLRRNRKRCFESMTSAVTQEFSLRHYRGLEGQSPVQIMFFSISPSELLGRGVNWPFYHSEGYFHWNIALLKISEGGAFLSVCKLPILSIKLKYPGFFMTFRLASFHFILFCESIILSCKLTLSKKNNNFGETLRLQPRRYLSISPHLHLYNMYAKYFSFGVFRWRQK